jgi:hypothetical protein
LETARRYVVFDLRSRLVLLGIPGESFSHIVSFYQCEVQW